MDSRRFVEVPLQALAWSCLDLGVQYGAILVERIRTFGGRLPGLELHCERLERGLHVLQLELPFAFESIPSVLSQLLECNRGWMAEQQDASVVMTISPGLSPGLSPGNEEWGIAGCTCMIHLLPLPWERLRAWHTEGAELVRSRWMSGAGGCWPSDIKARSRLNYFLADQYLAKNQTALAKNQTALALLSTLQGSVSDTSVANLLLIDRKGDWVSPKREEIVMGTSLVHSEDLLRTQGISIVFRDLSWEELTQAEELVLVGNSGCAWHARSIDGHLISDGEPGRGCRMLQRLWIERLGFDWLSQSVRREES